MPSEPPPYMIWNTILILTLITLLQKLYTILTHPLRSFPGPLLSSLTNIPYSTAFLRGRKEFYILELHRQYGPVVRIAPNELSFNTARSWKDIYGVRPGHGVFIKSDFYDGTSFIEEGVHGVISCRDPGEHGRMKKYLSPAFSKMAVKQQEGLVAEIVDGLVGEVRRLGVEGGEVMDLESWVKMCAFDITGSLAFGKSFDAVANGGQHPSVEFIHEALRQMSVLDIMRRFPIAGKIFALFFSRILLKLFRANKIHEAFVMKTIEDRLASPSTRPDFLTRLQESLDPTSPQSNVQIAAHAAELLQAGSDTTKTVIITVFNYILRDHDLYTRLATSIRAKFLTYESINSQDASTLPLLHAVILEAMRIYAPLPIGVPRVVPKGSDTIDGHMVAEGTIVSTNAFAACMSPANFADPFTFRPERWARENENGAERSGDILEASQPFGLGSRGCLGQNLAWMEMHQVICKMVWCFEVELVNVDMNLHRDSTIDLLWESPPLLVRVKERVLLG